MWIKTRETLFQDGKEIAMVGMDVGRTDFGEGENGLAPKSKQGQPSFELFTDERRISGETRCISDRNAVWIPLFCWYNPVLLVGAFAEFYQESITLTSQFYIWLKPGVST